MDLVRGTRKTTLRRLLIIQLGIRNYVSIDLISTRKRANSMVYYLSKFKKQILFLNLIRRSNADSGFDFVKKTVTNLVITELDFLDQSQEDPNFREGLDDKIKRLVADVPNIKNQTKSQKRKVLRTVRERLNFQVSTSTQLAISTAKRIRSFLEMFTSQEERYFLKIIVIDSPL